jgi:uncharacterized protein YjbJ (UPF0337 family)
MTREEFEGKWDQVDDKVPAKWGKLTRAERSELSGRRHSSQTKLHELYGVTEDEADRAIALERSRASRSPATHAPL